MDNLSPRLEGATGSAGPTRTPSSRSSLQEKQERSSPRAGSASPASPAPHPAAPDAHNDSPALAVAPPHTPAQAGLPPQQQQKSISRRSSRGLKKSSSNHSLPYRSAGGGGAGENRSQAESQTGHGAGKAPTAGEAGTVSRRSSRIEAGATASTPSFPVTSPDAFDAIVRASNPMHPDHAAWIERFGTLSRSGNKSVAAAASGSNSDIHGSPNGLSPPNGSGTAGSSVRRAGSTSSSQQPSRVGDEPTSPPQPATRSKRSASKSSQHSTAAAARAAAASTAAATLPAAAANGQKSRRTRLDGSDRDSDDAALAAGQDGPAAADTSVVGNGSGFLRPSRPVSGSVEGADAAKRRRRKREASNSTTATASPKVDKGKGKASPPPVPPPRITSSLNYLATVGVGEDGTGSLPTSPTSGMTPSSTNPDATFYSQGALSPPRSINGHDPTTSPQAFPPSAFPPSGYDSNNGSRQSFSAVRGTQSMDLPRVVPRTSSMFGEQDRPSMEDLAKAQQTRQQQQQGLPPVPPVPGWADSSLRSSRSGSKQSLKDMVSSVTGTGRRRSGSVRSNASSLKDEDRSTTGPYGVSSMPTTLNGRPTEARHLSTVYQEDTEAADEFFDANDDEPGSEMHAASQKATGATSTSIPLLHTNGALAKDDIRSNSGSGKQGRRGGGGSSRHSASYHSHSSKGTSPPIKDMSDREKKQFLAQNTYYIPPASRSSANATSSPPIAQQSDSALLRPVNSSPNLVPPKRPPKKNRGASSAKAVSEADFSVGAESAKTTSATAAETSPPPFSRRGSFWSKFSGIRRKQEDANFNEFAASIGLREPPAKETNQIQLGLPESPIVTKEDQLPPSPAPGDTSWRAKLFARGGSRTPTPTPKSPTKKSLAAGGQQEADRWRHDILSEAVTRSLAAPSTPTATSTSPKPQLAEDDFPEETTKKSLSPRLLSEEAGAASREGTWRSMAVTQEENVAKDPKQENGFVDDSRASPFLEQENQEVVEDPVLAASSPEKKPPSVPVKGFASVVSLPLGSAGRTSFSQDRNREPVMSPMLMAQQQPPQVKSPGLLGAFRDRFKSPRSPAMGQPVDSSSYQGIDGMLSPASSARSPTTVPPSPTPAEARPPPVVVQGIGLGIEDPGSEVHGASSLNVGGLAIDPPPPPPAKQSNDVKAFDDMLKGFGQADKQVRDTITMKAQEHFEKPI